MRKYHRWLSVVFGAFLLWIAATGVMIQLADLKAASEEEAEAGPAPQAGAVQVSRAQQGSNAGLVVKTTFICPAEMTCLPKPGPDSAKSWVSFLQGGRKLRPVWHRDFYRQRLGTILFCLLRAVDVYSDVARPEAARA
jgi:hypothetical protein